MSDAEKEKNSYSLPQHVIDMLDRELPPFRPPSFEPWAARLNMARVLIAMGAFLVVWYLSYTNGLSWESATVRALVTGVVFHFVAWAVGLFVFGELYDYEIEVTKAKIEQRARDRNNRIIEYYEERLKAAGVIEENSTDTSEQAVSSITDSYQQAA